VVRPSLLSSLLSPLFLSFLFEHGPDDRERGVDVAAALHEERVQVLTTTRGVGVPGGSVQQVGEEVVLVEEFDAGLHEQLELSRDHDRPTSRHAATRARMPWG
jgi:hypothetical protein